jgi:2-amino-4-hydroxy-6-hydroxymethyldihydropteridine diphosphokinase
LYRVFILLGSNLGFRFRNLLLAQHYITTNIGIIKYASSIYETAPWQVQQQTRYLNQCLEVHTYLSIFQLLNQTQKIEKYLGRKHKNQNACRTIDIDILFFDDIVLNNEKLTVPHPRLHLRKFTLIPLSEIANDFVHPILQKNTQELLQFCDDISEVKKYTKK